MSWGLFEVFGVELEYAIVDRETLAVRPIADELLAEVAGEPTDVEDGPIAWSNELVLHVIELKTNGPVPSLRDAAPDFIEAVRRIDALLEPLGAMLLPGGMHPLMRPKRDTRLWPHEGREVYEAYDRIFGCRRHGFANVQSMHLNLPFRDDAELARLHAAVRVVLPLLPALAASSPVCDGEVTGFLDARLEHYRTNQALVPSITGEIVPEPIASRAEYEARILEPMWRDVAPHDPDGLLRHEFLNSRGAIARFERDAVEIRLIDVQETPRADLALARIVAGAIRALVEERWASMARIAAIPTGTLARLLRTAMGTGPATAVDDPEVAAAFGAESGVPMGTLWQRVGGAVLAAEDEEARDWLRLVGRRGTLAERLLRRLGPAPCRERVVEVWSALAVCLVEDRAFV